MKDFKELVEDFEMFQHTVGRLQKTVVELENKNIKLEQRVKVLENLDRRAKVTIQTREAVDKLVIDMVRLKKIEATASLFDISKMATLNRVESVLKGVVSHLAFRSCSHQLDQFSKILKERL